MKLPYFKNTPQKKTPESVTFGGLNLSDSAKVGELRSGLNLSSDRAPFISSRGQRTSWGGFARGSALFGWNGLLVVEGTNLIYNGEIAGAVTEGPKQFATVNTKLCIWPDKKYLDLENSEFKSLEAELTAAAESVTFATNYLEMDIDPFIETGSSQYTYPTEPKVKIYTALDWDDVTGWTKTGETEVDVTDVAVGNLLIPTRVSASGALVIPTKTGEEEYTGTANDEGYYFEVTAATDNQTQQYRWEKWSVDSIYYPGTYSEGASSLLASGTDSSKQVAGYTSYSFNIYTGQFSPAGSYVVHNVSNQGGCYSTFGSVLLYDDIAASGAWATYGKGAVGPTGGGYYYTKGSTNYGYVYGASGAYPSNGQSGGYWYVLAGTSGFTGIMTLGYNVKRFIDTEDFTEHFKVGDIVNVSGCTTLTANNKNDLSIVSLTANRLTFAASTFSAGSEAGAVVVSRLIPDFEFICEKDNRLWGVIDQTIRCSALGDPTNFNEFVGVSTDSYAVPVGTEGDFTAICAYSGELLCWKESKLHKILGSYPAEYSLYTYDIDGVEAGSHKSLAIINEILYYKGINGIYAYSGGTPTLISYGLGVGGHTNAIAGKSKVKYYVSMQKDNAWGLYVYDTLRHIWLPEDAIHAADFAYQDGHLYFMNYDTGEILDTKGTGNEGAVTWSAEFVEFTESINKKGYSKLFIRVELGLTASLKVETSIDGQAYKQVFITHDETRRTLTIPLVPARCDEMKVRLSGTGDCVIKGIEREFSVGSEY